MNSIIRRTEAVAWFVCAIAGIAMAPPFGMQAQAALTVTNGLQLWWAADQSAIATNATGNVTSISDLSGNGNTGTPGPTWYAANIYHVPELGPTYVANGWGLNGLPDLHFTSPAQIGNVGDSLVADNSMNLTAGLSIFIVGRPQSNPAYPTANGVLDAGPLPGTNNPGDTFTRSSDFGILWVDNGVYDDGLGAYSATTAYARAYSPATGNSMAGTPVSLGIPNLYTITASSLGATQYLNQSFDASVAGSILPTNATDYIALSPNVIYQGYNQGYVGDIAEVLIYDTTLSPSDRTTVENYLYDKWFVEPIPEPSTLALLALAGALVWRRRRNRVKNACLTLGAVLAVSLLGMQPAQAALTVTNGLQLWWSADQSTIATNATGNVTSISDLSGNGNAGAPGAMPPSRSPSLGPTYVTNGWGLNGLPVMHFINPAYNTDSGNSLVAANSVDLTAGLSIFIVGRPDDNAFSRGNGVLDTGPLPTNVYGSDTFTRPSDFEIYWYENAAHSTAAAGAYNGAQQVQGSSVNLGIGALYDITASTLSATQYLNQSFDSSTSGSILPASAGYIAIGPNGVYQGYNQGYVGDIGEVLVYNTTLSSSDRIAVEDYLYNKWFVEPIPEPSSLALLGLGGLLLWRRRTTG